ncbi:energy transducer TonB [Alteromonas sp. H39]|uniref:energy transducer TonB n=1 Tax=Alteromonas sp. H39 TaxID=3389876 RepID=UPI0039E011CB
MRKLVLTVLVLGLVGCMSVPNLASQPKEIAEDELSNYWEMVSDSFSFNSAISYKGRPDGYVKIRYLIDSDGEVHDPDVVESEPEGVWDAAGLKAVKKMEFVPASDNADRMPVYVSTVFKFVG